MFGAHHSKSDRAAWKHRRNQREKYREEVASQEPREEQRMREVREGKGVL